MFSLTLWDDYESGGGGKEGGMDGFEGLVLMLRCSLGLLWHLHETSPQNETETGSPGPLETLFALCRGGVWEGAG